MTHHPYPFPVKQGADDAGAHLHPPHLLDVAAGDGLAVGDEGQGLQQRAAVTGGPFLPQFAYPLAQLLLHLKAVAGCHLHQLKTAVAAVGLDGGHHRLQFLVIGALIGAEHLGDGFQGQRATRRQQQALHHHPHFVIDVFLLFTLCHGGLWISDEWGRRLRTGRSQPRTPSTVPSRPGR